MHTASGLREVLDEGECRRLLTGVDLGHVAFTAGALPAIAPVVFAVDGGRLVFAAPAVGLAQACRGNVIAVGVDAHDRATGTAWSVTIVGQARLVTDAEDVAALQRLGLASWPVSEPPCFVAVDTGVITGWRVRGAQAAPVDGATEQHPVRASA